MHVASPVLASREGDNLRCLSTSCFFIGVGEISTRTEVKPSRIKAAATQFKSKIKEKLFFIIACGSLSLPFSRDSVPLVSPLLLRMTCFQSLPFCERSLSFLKFFFFTFCFLLLLFFIYKVADWMDEYMRCLKFSENPDPRCAGGSLQRALSRPEVPDPAVLVAVVVASTEDRLRALLCVSPPAASAPVGRPVRGLLFGF